jgi:hypothetical protein
MARFAPRAAPPSQCALSASGVRSAGRWDGRLDLGAACSALAPPRGTTSEAVAGRAPPHGSARGLRAPASVAPDGALGGSERLGGGVAAGDGVQREGRPQATGEARWRPPVSPPRPGQEPLARRDESRALQGHGLAQGRRRGMHGARPQAVSRVTPAAVHAPSVQLKTTLP